MRNGTIAVLYTNMFQLKKNIVLQKKIPFILKKEN